MTYFSVPSDTGRGRDDDPAKLSRLHGAKERAGALGSYLPGIVLTAVIAASAFGLWRLPLFSMVSPMISAIFIGIVYANVIGVQSSAVPGLEIAGKKVLRLAVALLGMQLTFGQLAQIGLHGVALTALSVLSTFYFTIWLGRVLGVDTGLSQLLAAGTSICGVSAIAAANSVAKADKEDVSYAVAAITLLGTIAMFLYPLLMSGLGLDAREYGLWVGLSIHEVAQVVAAGFQQGELAGQTAILAKLTRIVMLAPVIIGLAVIVMRSNPTRSIGRMSTQIVPLFVVGFLTLAAINSAGIIPDVVRSSVVSTTPVLLTVSLAAIGLRTNVGKLKVRGFRPLLLAAMSAVFIAAISFLSITLS